MCLSEWKQNYIAIDVKIPFVTQITFFIVKICFYTDNTVRLINRQITCNCIYIYKKIKFWWKKEI